MSKIQESEEKRAENLMSVDEAAEFLCVAPKTIRNWQYKRRLPYVKIFGAVRFRRADLESLIEQGYKEQAA